jgi:hypothetical protein
MVLEDTKQWVLTARDRCDYSSCPGQAYIKVTGVTGSLYFCSHHYWAITKTQSGKEKLEAFAYETIDETDKLIENRLQGDD